MAPAQELREAARLMRERAQAATKGPWEHPLDCEVTFGHQQQGNRHIATWIATTDAGDEDTPAEENAEYIASMHPGVALAVAGWLDDEAAGYEVYDAETQAFRAGDRDGDLDPAVTTARVYLGAGEGQ